MLTKIGNAFLEVVAAKSFEPFATDYAYGSIVQAEQHAIDGRQQIETEKEIHGPTVTEKQEGQRVEKQWPTKEDDFSYKPYTHEYEPAPIQAYPSSNYGHELAQQSPARAQEKRMEPPPVPPATPKTPERTSLFGSLKQAAASPTPKSAFGSFFSGASQALKSQTEAVLKKAVDTVNQVAAASDGVSKPQIPSPASTSSSGKVWCF